VDNEWLPAGVFARRSRLSTKALRLYASNGVLVPNRIDSANGYRWYHESQLRDARLVRVLRRAGMPLALVAQVLNAPHEGREALVVSYWAEVECTISYQRELVGHLSRTLSGRKDSYPMQEITTRDVPEQTVLTEQAHVNAANLSAWIVRAGTRQLDELARLGGRANSSLVIYHGEVNEDSDGPVEACLPISRSLAASSSLPTRVEPAHREAYTTVTRAQVRYPDIVSAYDGVERWISENGKTVTGPPREVYFADPSEGDENEPVADIAFPIE
jgi:DNA-binding transcriptional MerR regulator